MEKWQNYIEMNENSHIYKIKLDVHYIIIKN